MTSPRPLTDHEQKIVDCVEKDGCFVTGVFDPDGRAPNFSYSAGFPQSLGQGDVIVFGLEHSLMHRMINTIWRACSNGLKLVDGGRLSGVLDDCEVAVCEIERDRIVPDFFNTAIWYHNRIFGTALTGAFQIVWPGAKQGLFPWEPDCNDYVISQQPALYQPRLNS